MGVNGCAWVQMSALGRRGHVGHKNKTKGGGNCGLSDPDLGSMTGEISPNIMFCQTKAKWAQTTPDGCAGVRMGAIGCICTGE